MVKTRQRQCVSNICDSRWPGSRVGVRGGRGGGGGGYTEIIMTLPHPGTPGNKGCFHSWQSGVSQMMLAVIKDYLFSIIFWINNYWIILF